MEMPRGLQGHFPESILKLKAKILQKSEQTQFSQL